MNGFISVGILREPNDHVLKEINTFWYYAVSFDGENEDVSIVSEDMDLQEAICLYECLDKCVNFFKKEHSIKNSSEFNNSLKNNKKQTWENVK